MTIAHALVATLFSISCPIYSAAAKASEVEKVDTDFGYVFVNSLDVQAALAEGRAAKEAAREVLSLPNISFAIVEEGYADVRWGSSADGLVTYTWTFPNGSRRQAPRPATYVLRHEIGHDLFVRYLVPRTSDGQYSSDAPDWLDEMAAIAFEGPEQQLDRRRVARMDADEAGLLPLPRLLSMVHPEFGRERPAPTQQTYSIGTPASEDTIRYYSTIRAFYDFLVERTGTEAIVAELAAAFMRGELLEPWILERAGYGRREGSLESMNAGFLRWFSEDPRYRFEQRTHYASCCQPCNHA